MNPKYLLGYLLMVVFFFLGNSFVPFETHIITLHVDTGKIENGNIDQVCTFGQGDGVSNEDFTIVVKPGDVIMWQGVSSNAPETDQVLISAINYEGGARIFSKNTLKDSRQNLGVVLGTVSEGKDGDEHKYKLSFKVLNSGEKRGGTFNIDPKIKIKS